jgi:anaerobic selenocysteine-containing dehydrogenase
LSRRRRKVEKEACSKCGEPFVSRLIFDRLLREVKKKNLRALEKMISLCPRCRLDVYAQSLIGDRLRKVHVPLNVTERRLEKMETIKTDKRTGATVYKSCCYICNSGCDALVYVKNGKVIKIEGDPSSPVTKGTLCPKGLASTQLQNHPDRLKYPMMRVGERGEGEWRRISWEEAFNMIVQRFKEIEEKYGKNAIILATGTQRGFIRYFVRFANAWGKQWIGPGIAQCFYPRVIAGMLVLGGYAMECPDYDHTKCMLIWGANPPATWPVKALGMMEARVRGAKMIVVDPVFSETASKADLWLQLRPGTDAALALSMLHVIINEELYDKDFVEKWCVGFEQLRERVQQYPPRKVEDITWVPKQQIIEAARIYATTKPACITLGVSVDQNADTISTSRAIAMLAAITGNIDVPGGNIFPMDTRTPERSEIELKYLLDEESHEKRLGSKEYPLLAGRACPLSPSAHPPSVWKAILTGKPYSVRALYAHGTNIVLSYANSEEVKKALMSLDFLVVADLFMTETAALADIVLPAATWMERSSVVSSLQTSYRHVHLQQKTVEPLEECRSDYDILNELARRLGFEEYMFRTEEDFGDYMLKDWGITFEEFKKLGILSVPNTYKKYEKSGFKTPSGKVELYSKFLQDLGFDPLPSYKEPDLSPISTPELAKEYPLIITTGGRVPVFRHTELRNIPWLRETEPEPRVLINPKTASELSIKNGDPVVVESPIDSMEAKAYLTDGIHPRVVQVPSHWGGWQNVNRIMDNKHCAPLIGGTQLRCQLCRVRRKNDRDD